MERGDRPRVCYEIYYGRLRAFDCSLELKTALDQLKMAQCVKSTTPGATRDGWRFANANLLNGSTKIDNRFCPVAERMGAAYG